MQNLTIAVSLGVFVIWMQRHHRWSLFYRAAQGDYGIVGVHATNRITRSGKEPTNTAPTAPARTPHTGMPVGFGSVSSSTVFTIPGAFHPGSVVR